MPFTKGNPGRPKGALNKSTIEIKDAARKIIEDFAYHESLRRRILAGKAPHMETLLFYYAYGKPKDTVDMPQLDDLAALLARKVVHECHPGPTKGPNVH